MLLLLEPRVKTVPSNYSIQGYDLSLGIAPGESCTEDQWDKAERQESEFYDWKSYERCVLPKVEHPEYVKKSEDYSCYQKWEVILNELEPLPRLP